MIEFGPAEMLRMLVHGEPLRVLSLWNPWATLMSLKLKRWETRSWASKYEGLVCIHAAQKWNLALRLLAYNEPAFAKALDGVTMSFGRVLSIGRLGKAIRTEEWVSPMSMAPCEYEFGDYSPGRYAWPFTRMVRLAPIALKASQGLFHAPAELRATVILQLEHMVKAEGIPLLPAEHLEGGAQ